MAEIEEKSGKQGATVVEVNFVDGSNMTGAKGEKSVKRNRGTHRQ